MAVGSQLILVDQVDQVVQVVVEMDMVQQDLLEQDQDLKEPLIQAEEQVEAAAVAAAEAHLA